MSEHETPAQEGLKLADLDRFLMKLKAAGKIRNAPPGFKATTAGDIARQFREASPDRRVLLSLLFGGDEASWSAVEPDRVMWAVEAPPPGGPDAP